MGWTATAWGGVDGDFTTPQAASEIRFTGHPLPEQSNAIILKQTFWQFRANWAPQDLNTAGPSAGQNTYLIDETELQDMGGGLVAWDRVWASLPNPYNVPVTIQKTIQQAWHVYQGTVDPRPIVDSSIVSWVKTVNATEYYDYYLTKDAVPGIPVAPFISQTRLFNSGNTVTDFGSGFPVATFFGTTAPHNNLPVSFISGFKEPWLGKMWRRRMVYG